MEQISFIFSEQYLNILENTVIFDDFWSLLVKWKQICRRQVTQDQAVLEYYGSSRCKEIQLVLYPVPNRESTNIRQPLSDFKSSILLM